VTGTFTLPATARVGRVCLRVGSLDRALPFYREVVGLSGRAAGGGPSLDDRSGAAGDDDGASSRATLSAGGTPLVVLAEDPDAPARPPTAAGLFHLALRVPDRAALGEALRRARTAGALSGASDHLVSEALYLRDPEGNGVEVYRDRPREEWPRTADGRVSMATEPLDADGVLAAADAARDGDRDPGLLPTGTDVGHVHLEVTDLDRATAFYTGDLGLTVSDDGYAGASFVAAGGYHHHVGLNTWNGRSDPVGGHRGLAWVELVVDDGARDRLAAHLAGRGVSTVEADGATEVVDPDGVRWRVRAA
jgi:catechol 2,3-dioxygenase